jgi:hypothetical protein
MAYNQFNWFNLCRVAGHQAWLPVATGSPDSKEGSTAIVGCTPAEPLYLSYQLLHLNIFRFNRCNGVSTLERTR